MPRRGWHPPRRGSPESPSPRRLTRTAAIAHALADYVLREVWFRALHAAPPAHRPDHTGRPEIVVKHLLAALSPVPCPSLWFLKVVPEALRFMQLSPDACWRGQLGLRGRRSLCWRCARLGGWLALGVLAARAARCAARASRCAACSAARFAPASTLSRLSACQLASQAGVSASVVIGPTPRCQSSGASPTTPHGPTAAGSRAARACRCRTACPLPPRPCTRRRRLPCCRRAPR